MVMFKVILKTPFTSFLPNFEGHLQMVTPGGIQKHF
jgi:hypothetical protein